MQAEQHLLDQIALEHANAHLEVVSLTLLLQAVVHHHQIIVLQVLFLQHLIHVLVILQVAPPLIQAILVHVQVEAVVLIRRKQDVLVQHHVHVQLGKVHQMVVTVLETDM